MKRNKKGLSLFCDIALNILVFFIFLYILIRCLFVVPFGDLFGDLFVDPFSWGLSDYSTISSICFASTFTSSLHCCSSVHSRLCSAVLLAM